MLFESDMAFQTQTLSEQLPALFGLINAQQSQVEAMIK